MPAFNQVTVTVQRTVFSKYDDRTYVDHHQIHGCTEYPTANTAGTVGYRTESATGGGEVLNDARTLLVPAGSDVLSTDRVIIHPRGVALIPAEDKVTRKENAYQVLGRPMDWSSPLTGWAPGMEITLLRVA